MDSAQVEQMLRQLAALLGASIGEEDTVASMSSGTRNFLNAAAQGDKRQCQTYVKNGGNPNVQGSKGLTALHVAAHEGHLELIRELLKLGAKINATDKDGDTPLICAVINRKDDAVDLLIELGADVRHLNNKGLSAADVALMKRSLTIIYSLEGVSQSLQFDSEVHEKTLMAAAQEGSFRIIEFWLQNHPDRRACDHHLGQRRTIAFIAALNGHLDIMQLLESKGADFELTDERGHTPLFCAAQNDHYEIVQFLVTRKCNVNHQSSSGRTPIFSAVNNGHEDIVQLLIRSGADVNLADEDDRTPLESAVKRDSIPIFKMLVEAGADVKQVNGKGYDLAMCAADNQKLDMLKELKRLGVSLTRVNPKNGETALLGACQVGPGEVVEYLLKEGSAKNHTNKRGISPGLRAVYNGHLDVVQVLFDAGANLDMADSDGDTPILCAAMQNNLELVVYLSEHRCNIAAKNNRGRTLVWFAAKNGNLELLEFLQGIEAPMDAPDSDGNTPLMVAAKEGSSPDAVSFLVRCGCSLGKRNQKGEKAEDIAKKANHGAVLAALTQTRQDPGARDRIAKHATFVTPMKQSATPPPQPASPGGVLDASFRKWNFMLDDKGKKKSLGSGGFGDVFMAITDKHQIVAVKVVKLRGLLSEDVKRIVNQEQQGIEILSTIRHPNILEFLKCERMSNGDFCIFTELVSGISLFDLMQRQKQAFDENGIKKFSTQICQALNFLHSRKRPVLHRDIKCSNIMLANQGTIKLIDFGLAKEIVTSFAAYTSSTTTGTLCFMAPELLKDDGHRVVYSDKSDVWAFGCAVYEMANRLPPNARLLQGPMINAIVSKPMPQLPSNYSKLLADFYSQCVIKDKDLRANTDMLLKHPFLSDK